jgi:hypothetical protein
MANYGLDFYGLAYYGADNLVDFDASPFTALPVEYGKILVQWTEPTGNWDKLRLVRNPFGFPMTPDDGDILYQLNVNSGIVYYEDEGQVPNNSGLLAGHTYYYSIFVRETTQLSWQKAGETLGVSVKNYGTIDTLYDALPEAYKVKNVYSAEYNLGTNDDLYNFLRIFAFEHDLFKTMAQNVSERYDVLNLDGRLMPLMLNQFGIAYEPEIGLQQARIFLKNYIKLTSEKGSLAGLKTFVKSFTGFNCEIADPINLMLEADSASFRESIGRWAATNATLTRATAESESPVVLPYEEINSPTNHPNGQKGLLKIVSTGGDIELTCGQTRVLYNAIPVTAGSTYSFTVYGRYKTTNKTLHVDIKWYDRNGVLLGTAGEQDTTTLTNSAWTRTNATTGAAPATAYFAVPYIRIEGTTSGDTFYLDAAQFEKNSYATTFADARRVDVILKANRINEVINASFEVDTATWVVTNGTINREATSTLGNIGSYALKVTSGSTTPVNLATDYFIPIVGGEQYSAGALIRGEATSTDLVGIEVNWFDEALNPIDGELKGSQVLAANWQFLNSTYTAPENAAFAKLNFVFGALGTMMGNEAFIDLILFERAAYYYGFFDGASGYAQLSDLVWEGDAYDSRSHYYKNRLNIQVRLTEVLKDYLPYGIPWAIFVAQPD